MKVCSKCKIEKPETEFFKSTKNKDGLRGSCKVCHQAQTTSWRELNRELYNRNARNYYARDKDKISKRRSESRQNNKELRDKDNARCRAYSKSHRQELNKSRSEWIKRNPEKKYAMDNRYWVKKYWGESVSPEIINIYKLYLQLKRELQKCNRQKQSTI